MASPIECDDRFYSKEEYKSLSPGNRVYLRQIRDKRTGSTTDNGPNKRMRASSDTEFSRTLSVLASAVDQLEVRASETAPAAPVAPAPTPVSNATNSALQRIVTRQKAKSD